MTTAIGTYRYRLNLDTTVRDGYRVGDATIEFSEIATFGGERDREEFRRRLNELIEDGQVVAEQMNKRTELARTTSVTAPTPRKDQ